MRPHSIILVLLPSQLAKSFFPQMDQYLSEHHGPGGKDYECQRHSSSRQCQPERLPGGLGILCIETAPGAS